MMGGASQMGHVTLDTSTDLLGQDLNFFGKKQMYRLKTEDDKYCGTVYIRFRKLTKAQEENYFLPIVEGVDNESGLGAEVQKSAIQMQLPDNLRNIKGELKCRIVARCIQTKIVEISGGLELDHSGYLKVVF